MAFRFLQRLALAASALALTTSLPWLARSAAASGPTPMPPETSAAAGSVLQVALAELDHLDSFADSSRARIELLRRNISRYFVVNLMPTDGDEFGRVIGSAERMSRRAAGELYRAAEALAKAAGSATIRRQDVDQVLAEALPSAPTGFGELVFFPKAAAPVILEVADLQAFHDTGFCWQVVSFLAQAEIQPDPTALAMEPEAVRALAHGVNAYGLLAFRIGGRLARLEFAPYLQSHHLRTAGKTIADKGEGLPAAPRPQPVGGSWYRDVAEESGIRFRHVTSDWLARFRRFGHVAPTFSGGGVSAGHLDEDDRTDLVFCGGRGCAVFRGAAGGRFEDATAASGLAVDGEARMAVIADLDNDGRSDVFITYARDTNRLFRGAGGGRFRDVTAGSGLERQGDISGPAVAFDYDNDGLLDLYVGNFGNYLAGEHPWSPNASDNGMPNRLYHNLGNLRFEDVSERAGVGDTGWTQALSHVDYDLDGDQDLYIANDFGANDLLINNGDGTFTSAGELTGSSDPFHGMNVAYADLNRDRHPDIFISNIWFWNHTRDEVTETNSLLLSSVGPDGRVMFERVEDPELLRHDTGWAWGAVFFDADNDADDDLYVVNGFTDYLTFIQYRRSPNFPGELYAINNGSEPNWFFVNDDGLPVRHVPNSGAELDGVNSRAVAPLDFDGDGDIDLAVSTFHSTARLFRNDGAPPANHWLSIELVGDPATGASRDAVGTQVIARGDPGLYVWRMRTGGEGYLAMIAPEIHMGLGRATAVELEVIWPGNQRQVFSQVPADRRLRLRQGESEIELLSPVAGKDASR